jgi:pimeloyl-ACP methyl ester carboxylesterase
MPSVFALLVGINTYHKDTGVSGLNGCVNDIDAIRDYIRTNFPQDAESNIIALKNEQATRSAVIENFKSHLIKNPAIKEGDTVLFYYSGHGSYAQSATEFLKLNEDSKGQDETLVLYDSRCEGNFDLADKELALLLSEIPSHANTVVILDSCHSGSATRAAADQIRLGAPRFTSASHAPRALKDYTEVDGHGYLKMLEDGTFGIPNSKHLLLAACGRDELAYESADARGLFSSLLTSHLEDAAANVTYAALYEDLYAIIKRKAARQTPQLKVYEGFNPYLSFLQNKSTNGKPLYKVVYNQKAFAWVINYGALNGMPPDKNILTNCQVQLYALSDAAKPLHTVAIKETGLNESILNMPAGVNTQQVFTAEVLNLPPTLTVCVTGGEPETAAFFSFFKQNGVDRSLLQFHQQPELFQNLMLDVQPEQLVIRDAKTGELLHGVETLTKDSVDYIVDALLQIAKWKALEQLENKQTMIPVSDVQFAFQIQNREGVWEDCDGENLTFDITPERTEVPFNIRLTNTSARPYYFALYNLSSTFKIEKYSQDTDASLLTKDDRPALKSDNGSKSLVLSDDTLNEETEVFKLVYSPDIFFDYFVEEDRELTRGIVTTSKDRGTKGTKDRTRGDWAAKTITVRLVRQLQQVNREQGYSNHIISIKPHPSFAAAVSITPMDSAAKSYNPAKALEQIFADDTFEIINLGERSRGDEPPQSVIELSGVENEAALEAEPLEINLNYKLAEDEQMLAVTFSDGLVQPIGFLEKAEQGDTHTMKLHQAPAQQDSMRTAASKNPVRALWFCFLKVVLKRDDDVFKLRYIEYKDGKAGYSNENVSTKVAQSPKIALVIHGIIGNTKSLAVNMEAFLNEGIYDCILCFDYENLNTGITKIAVELKERLGKAGISPQKKIDIIAHSMGGLVSRYMIERLDGDVLVNRLFMLGTPNAGSNFGKLVTFRNWATGILTLACNYGKSFLGQFGPFLEGVNAALAATKPITNTLEEMGVASDFLKDLNETQGEVRNRYFIVAGNTKNYTSQQEPGIRRMMEKIELGVGKLLYRDVANDIAVSVDSIKKVPGVPAENIMEIGCHHLNYFDYEPSMQELKKFIG